MRVWCAIKKPSFGFLDNLSDGIALIEQRNPGLLAAVDDSAMWISSDYSGQHESASCEAYAFLVTTARALRAWNRRRITFRQKYLPDGRRLSFKKLKEPVRRRALAPFLTVADELHGNLVTIVIDKCFSSLFKKHGAATWDDLPGIFPEGTSANVVEKSLRLGTFISLILAGFRHERQPATWISDQDDSLENHDRRERIAEFISYTTYVMAGWKNPAPVEFGTTVLDVPDRRLEDFVALPDLVAGAFADLAPLLSIPEKHDTIVRIENRDKCCDWRTREIVDWYANRDTTLKRILLRVVRDQRGAMRARAESFGLLHVLPTTRSL